jgi:hypothetical protein
MKREGYKRFFDALFYAPFTIHPQRMNYAICHSIILDSLLMV